MTDPRRDDHAAIADQLYRRARTTDRPLPAVRCVSAGPLASAFAAVCDRAAEFGARAMLEFTQVVSPDLLAMQNTDAAPLADARVRAVVAEAHR